MDGTAIGTGIAAIGAILVAYQIRAANKIAHADFALRLESDSLNQHLKSYQKLIPGGEWANRA